MQTASVTQFCRAAAVFTTSLVSGFRLGLNILVLFPLLTSGAGFSHFLTRKTPPSFQASSSSSHGPKLGLYRKILLAALPHSKRPGAGDWVTCWDLGLLSLTPPPQESRALHCPCPHLLFLWAFV